MRLVFKTKSVSVAFSPGGPLDSRLRLRLGLTCILVLQYKFLRVRTEHVQDFYAYVLSKYIVSTAVCANGQQKRCSAKVYLSFNMVEKQPNQIQALSAVALCLLCIPATSVPSERVFLVAGLTIAKDRARLAPQTANELIFLHDTLPAIRNYEESFHAQ